MSDNYHTSYSLLGRALDLNDKEAWAKLSEKYRSFIYYILVKFNIPNTDIDDVAQLIMVDLFQKLETYDREKGRFRSWFSRLIKNRAIENYRKVVAHNKKIDHYEHALSFFDTTEEAEIESLIEKEWIDYITIEAVKRVEESYTGKAVQAFQLGLKGYSIKEVAEQLDLTENSVYSYRQRMKKSLKIEVRSLIADLEGYVG